MHHKTYDRLGAERFSDLLLPCRRCHELISWRYAQYPRRIGNRLMAEGELFRSKWTWIMLIGRHTIRVWLLVYVLYLLGIL